RTLLPRTRGRTAFLTAKLIALALFAVVLVLVGYLAALGSSALVTVLLGQEPGLGDQVILRSLAAVARTAYVMLPYLALAVLVALWARSGAAGIGVGLAVLLVEGLLTSLLGRMSGPVGRLLDVLLGQNVDAVLRANGTGTGVSVASPTGSLPDLWQAA